MGIITDNFMLKNETARLLYHRYAEKMPIIDYHCHISPQDIYEDRKFDNITQIWLGGDHYKWRLIRSDGISEDEITGDADPFVKFKHFAAMLPKAIGNPMYHWTHLELKRYFDYDGILDEDTAAEVYALCNKRLQQPDMTVRNLIKKSNVKMIGTTDDPIDSLEWHIKLREDQSFPVAVLPSFRPDKAVNIEKAGFAEYIIKLSAAAGIEINGIEDVKKALSNRLDFFCELGCRATDHGLDYVVYSPAADAAVEKIFQTVMNGGTVPQEEADRYKTAIMLHLGKEYAKRGIVMQLHYGAQRNTNANMFDRLGPDTGFDCISTKNCGENIVGFLDALERQNALPKTILYSLNPQDNELLDTIIGCFQGTETAGKLQHGAAWWFNDTRSGMEAQVKSLANLSLLGNFIGMLTDSRSFLSYTRHEYFRRILCSLIGEWVEEGEYPNDEKRLGKMIEDLCFHNAKRYFGI
ncbi:MAG: glucuronate isomerase [Oscillospiraceae bacterium]|nr:glucuronate isomerase [Oscillospiraceae bacterium]